MPQVDMPLEQLKTYMGTNPCPPDIDAFWDTAIAEMRALDPKVKLIPSKFQVSFAECFDLYFTGAHGASVHAKYLRPRNYKEPHPAVVMFHGYGGDSGDWADKLNYVAAGFSVAAMDVRGQAGLSEDVGGVHGNTLGGHILRGLEDTPDKLLFKDIYLDTAELARIVMDMPEVDASRVGATGGSQGGALTIACASLEPCIKKAAFMFPFLCDYKRVWEMDLAKGPYSDLSAFFRNSDPLHQREDEIFQKLGYIDLQHIAKRIGAEVMMITGLMDTICPPSTQFAAYNKITSSKEMVIYPDFGHEGLPGSADMIFSYMMGL